MSVVSQSEASPGRDLLVSEVLRLQYSQKPQHGGCFLRSQIISENTDPYPPNSTDLSLHWARIWPGWSLRVLSHLGYLRIHFLICTRMIFQQPPPRLHITATTHCCSPSPKASLRGRGVLQRSCDTNTTILIHCSTTSIFLLTRFGADL